jgi:hypothetical protein
LAAISRDGIADSLRQEILQASSLANDETQALTNLNVLNVSLGMNGDRKTRV